MSDENRIDKESAKAKCKKKDSSFFKKIKERISNLTNYGIAVFLVSLVLGAFSAFKLKKVALGGIIICLGSVICLALIFWPRTSKGKADLTHKDQVSKNAIDDFIFRLVSVLLTGESIIFSFKKAAEEMRTSKVKDQLVIFLKPKKSIDKETIFDFSLCGDEQKEYMELVFKCLDKKLITKGELLSLESYLNSKNNANRKEKFSLKEADVIVSILSLSVIGYFLYLCVTSL